jgi:drug/metabolite transporter (DMT)-like permease
MKIIFYTGFALVCFAFNSILCRLALGMNLIDAASFTTVRIVSGAITLLIIFSIFGKRNAEAKQGNWLSAFFLFAYAICFSFAYNELTTGMGALILFGCVQATMIIFALVKGERPNGLEWLGLIVAVAGLVYLVSPGLTAPPVFSAVLMAFAGIAWGFYTLRGKGSANPLGDTAGNFIRVVPFVLIAALPFINQIHLSKYGVLFAVLSGAIASGIGYAVWYAALKFHTATRAAILQLSVPALAAIGGILLLPETVNLRLIISALLILGGICVAILGRNKFKIS